MTLLRPFQIDTIELGQDTDLQSNILHDNLSGVGTNTHANIDAHITGSILNHTAADILNVPTGSPGIGATNVQAALDELVLEKAALDSPVFIGTPTAPTQTIGDNSTRLATTAYSDANIIPGILSVADATAIDIDVNENVAFTQGLAVSSTLSFLADKTSDTYWSFVAGHVDSSGVWDGSKWVCTTTNIANYQLWPVADNVSARPAQIEVTFTNFNQSGGVRLFDKLGNSIAYVPLSVTSVPVILVPDYTTFDSDLEYIRIDFVGTISTNVTKIDVIDGGILVGDAVDGSKGVGTINAKTYYQDGVEVTTGVPGIVSTADATAMTISSDESIEIGTPAGGAQGPGTINAEAIYVGGVVIDEPGSAVAMAIALG